MAFIELETQDIKNIAGVGYIQGLISMALLGFPNNPHSKKLTIDGMFGKDTLNALLFLLKKTHNFDLTENQLDSLQAKTWGNPTYYNGGIRDFQKIYTYFADHCNNDLKCRFPQLPTFFIDGRWGNDTRKTAKILFSLIHSK